MSKQTATIAVIDDDHDVLVAAQLFLKRHFTDVLCYSDPSVVEALAETKKADVFLLDMNFALGTNTGEEGLHWLDRALKLNPEAVVVLMTAYGDVDTSVKAIKSGAADFVLKPWNNEKLLATLNASLLLNQSRQQLSVIKQQYREPRPLEQPVVKSDNMLNLYTLAEKAAATDVNVLILGENGVGKEVLAKHIHTNSGRSEELLVSVDLGAIPETLFESELFGHVKGAFTGAHTHRAGRFQAASGGTLFLDEIGNLPLHLQAKLLRVLETREVTPVGSDKTIAVDVRLICATNMPLPQHVDEGAFRSDLFYRINTVELEIPPLRDRPEDIASLLNYFSQQVIVKYKLPHKTISEAAIAKACEYNWPGNVRELAHAVERALILSDQSQLMPEDFHFHRKSLPKNEMLPTFNLEEVERYVVEQVLKKHKGNISHCAKELGITRTSLYRRLKKYKL